MPIYNVPSQNTNIQSMTAMISGAQQVIGTNYNVYGVDYPIDPTDITAFPCIVIKLCLTKNYGFITSQGSIEMEFVQFYNDALTYAQNKSLMFDQVSAFLGQLQIMAQPMGMMDGWMPYCHYTMDGVDIMGPSNSKTNTNFVVCASTCHFGLTD